MVSADHFRQELLALAPLPRRGSSARLSGALHVSADAV